MLRIKRQRVETSRAVSATISGADHPVCTAAFRSPRIGRGGSAFPCFALPRRYCSTASTALGRQPKCVDDRFFGCSLSLLHLPDFRLDWVSVSICGDWYGFWRHSRLARFGDDALGKPARRTFLHSAPLARTCCHVGSRSTFYLRLVARTPAAALQMISIG
jgi:hypothetical protein